VCEVALRQQHDGLRAALPPQDEVALETTQVQVLVEGADDEDDVDVRGENLLLGRLPGVLRENFVRRGRTAWIVPASSSARGATATQSPTAGRSAGDRDSS
jgi:hypothetical protein